MKALLICKVVVVLIVTLAIFTLVGLGKVDFHTAVMSLGTVVGGLLVALGLHANAKGDS